VFGAPRSSDDISGWGRFQVTEASWKVEPLEHNYWLIQLE